MPELRSLGSPLRRLAEMQLTAPLLYVELGGLKKAGAAEGNRIRAACKRAVGSAMLACVGNALRRHDLIAAGPSASWFVALLLDRAAVQRRAGVLFDADLGVAAARVRVAVQTALDDLERARIVPAHVVARAGWTVIEPVDPKRPLEGLRHAVRGAAVLARVEHRRAVVLASVTHELRAPLTSIVGYIECLQDGAELTKAQQRRYLRVVADEARRLNHLVGGLIDIGAYTTGNLKLRRERAPIRVLIRDAWRIVAARAGQRGVRLRIEGVGAARLDRDRMLEVMINVLDNAVRHARKGGVVEVRISAGSSGCQLRVCDDGAGFDPLTVRTLGRPFSAGPRGQAGLGLAIAQLLVEAHGGSIGVSGGSKTGGRVIIRLPS
ncbi:MAG: HAMP domain-containing histidine kinase [Candidatus Eremiobacteraeota bacterium]|nr:HAMP domain-containing histidine kinase [Candidatus Eremiobacteraeota bacterium]MBC5828189.1 HAMP domain-containing histidine kinase [Candidatus Eremiobacteraeota bacterium]